jgi:hypothetical protein
MQATQNVTAFENNEKPIIDLLDRRLAFAIDLQLRLRSALCNMEDPRLAETRELDTTASEIEQLCNLINRCNRHSRTSAWTAAPSLWTIAPLLQLSGDRRQ